LSQCAYIDKVLKWFNMIDFKKKEIYLCHMTHLSKAHCPTSQKERETMAKMPYASVMGSIMYSMLCTHSDVSYPLSVTSRYQSDPGQTHWITVKNILKYLQRTRDNFLIYGGEQDLIVSGYMDVSFQIDRDDSKSQSGFVFLLNGGVKTWKSFKQEIVVDSDIKVECIAASEATKGVWIKNFLTELEVVPSILGPVDFHCDNTGAIAQSKESRSHQRFKHVMRRFHLIREIVN
jgi:hypothetical protein